MGVDRTIDITAEQRRTVRALLEQYLPGTAVWAYGSRVKWNSRPQSDLDLVVFATPDQGSQVGALREAFEESNLPFRVDLFVWDDVPEEFRKHIQRDHVVLVEREHRDVGGGWREATLDQLGRIVTGKTPPSKIQGSFGGDIPFVTPSDLDGRRVIASTVRFLTAKGFETVCKSRIPVRSVMVSCIGSDMGKAAMSARECVTNQQINSIVVDSGDEPLFVYYNLSSRKVEIHAAAGGSAQPILNKSGFGQLAILLPPPDQQRTIAHILGTLDDKIDLNRRMNETLEAMVQALFKSWFVDFDPVRTKMEGRWRRGESLPGLPAEHYDLFPDRLVDSELGEIPEEWEVKALEEFGDVITGKTPSTRIPEFYGDDVPFLKIPDMHGKIYVVETSSMLSSVGASSQALKTLPSGSISVSCIATPGLVVLNHRNIQTNQQINSIIPRDRSLNKYLYWSCRHLSADIKTGGLGGSVFGNMNKSIFSALPVLNPESAAIRAFDQFVSPIHATILANEEQSQTLSRERDSLLPKLISGELARISQCAVERRFLPAGAKPARQLSLQPVAVGAVHGGNDMD